MSTIRQVIRQPESTVETRAALQACMLDGIVCTSVAFTALGSHAQELRSGAAVPVGSVEYVREAMRVAGLIEPENMSYPAALDRFLHREINRRAAGQVIGNWFVKPVTTKAFTGFVFDTMQDPITLDEHDREQYDAFMDLSPDTEVWLSEPVRWVSEVRYYVTSGVIKGSDRYDPDGADDAPLPDVAVVNEALEALKSARGASVTCSIDMGVLSTGETALVEVNDGWAIGLYGSALRSKDYLELLIARWQQICEMTP